MLLYKSVMLCVAVPKVVHHPAVGIVWWPAKDNSWSLEDSMMLGKESYEELNVV